MLTPVPCDPDRTGPSADASLGGQQDHRRMFVRYYLELPRSFEDLERALLTCPEAWVPGIARAAGKRGERLLGEVGFGHDGRRLVKQVEIELGQPIRYPSKTVLPMTWRAAGAEMWFPSFEGDIEVGTLGRGHAQLSVSARYCPPLGPVGRMIDRALLHRVAEATIKDFLDRAGERLSDTTPGA